MVSNIKILVCPDKFKGSLDAVSISDTIEEELLNINPSFIVKKMPMADGGDGTIDILQRISGGDKIYCRVFDPLFREIETYYLSNGDSAYIEMAKTTGLSLLSPNEYNPAVTSSYGLGQIIRQAYNNGHKKIYICVGGSATNDGGCGALSALGVLFRNENGEILSPQQTVLKDIHQIDRVEESYQDAKFYLVNDVDNPLYGENGATYIYSPQKGADFALMATMEKQMIRYSKVMSDYLGYDKSHQNGAGAAGGVGYAMLSFLNAEQINGWKLISDISGVSKEIDKFDLIITGEGSFDKQSLSGKVFSGVARLTNGNIPIWIICGKIDYDITNLIKYNVVKIDVLSDLEATENESIKNTRENLKKILQKSATFLLNIPSNDKTN